MFIFAFCCIIERTAKTSAHCSSKAFMPLVAPLYGISMKILPIQKMISNTLRKLIPVKRPISPPERSESKVRFG